tara:strand:+ start:858 stop:1538 length:681 start_codon:yes stop_codon:yes gene_type:complete
MAGLLIVLAGFASTAANNNWPGTVERTPVAHVIGNPAAPVTLTEYISYTCPHCRDFAMLGEEVLKQGLVREGKLRFEYRHVIANPIDLTATMLARCGAPEKFPANHSALMIAQPQFNAIARLAVKSQTDRWYHGDPAARRRAIASDLNLYPILERRGYSRSELDQCLADQALAERLEAAGEADREEKGVPGTPSFAINGTLLEGVHNWQSLQAAMAQMQGGDPAGQ